mgnify:CR=1 FL=1
MILNRDGILGCIDVQIETVEVPQWKGSVYIKSLNGKERDAFESACLTGRGTRKELNLVNMRARLVAVSVVDEDGKLIFTEEDVQALGEKNAGALDLIFTAAQRLSGLGQKDVEELTKNSEPDQN